MSFFKLAIKTNVVNHGFSLHYEFYDLALEIFFLFTSDCTQVVERLMLA